jgi:hypothetical protein
MNSRAGSYCVITLTMILAVVREGHGQYHHSVWHDKFALQASKRTRVVTATQVHKSIDQFTKTATSNHVLTDIRIKKRPASDNYGFYNSVRRQNKHLVRMRVRTNKGSGRIRINRYQKPKTR